jgi:hypothetical protein
MKRSETVFGIFFVILFVRSFVNNKVLACKLTKVAALVCCRKMSV